MQLFCTIPDETFVPVSDNNSNAYWNRCSAWVAEQRDVYLPALCAFPCLPSTTSLFTSLWKLISSDMTKLWKPWAEVLQMLCHHTKHGRRQTPRQRWDAAWEIGDGAVPHHRLFDFSLYFSFQLRWQTALRLPCSAGLVLMLLGKSWQGIGSKKASPGYQREKWFFFQTTHTAHQHRSCFN